MIMANKDAFMSAVKEASEVEIHDMIDNSKIKELVNFMNEESLFTEFCNLISDNNLEDLLHKTQPAAYTPGAKDKFVLASVANLRQRATFQLLLIGMVSYLYRSLEERYADNFARSQLDPLTAVEYEGAKKFLNQMFEYNPTEHVDRITSELFTNNPLKKDNKGNKDNKGKGNKVQAKTMNIKTQNKETRVIDFTRKGKKGQSKDKVVDRGVAEMEFTDKDIKVTIDPPVDFYGNFMNYYNTHFDGIYKTAFELFIEQRTGTTEDQMKFYTEEVVMKSFDPVDPDNAEKKVELAKYTLPSPQLQHNWALMVHAPPDGKFYASVLMSSWAASKKNVVIDDVTVRAIMKKQEEDMKVYQHMAKHRVMKSTLINMIEQGPYGEEFKEYIKNMAPDGVEKDMLLDDFEQEELERRYKEFVNKHKVYSNEDEGFMNFVRTRIPASRDLNKSPLRMDERKKFSEEYNDSVLMKEVHEDNVVGLDFYDIGPSGVEKNRQYLENLETSGGRI
jgi:hypothetical protein